jgi:hypothetical protein
MRCPVAEFDDGYEVGYGKPPKETKFMKGRSGNPKGRPKGSKNLATSFMEIGREQITVTEGGRTRTMTKAEAVVHQLTNKAASGDPRARREYFQVHKILFSTNGSNGEKEIGRTINPNHD